MIYFFNVLIISFKMHCCETFETSYNFKKLSILFISSNSFGFHMKLCLSLTSLRFASWSMFIYYYTQYFLRGVEHVCLLMQRNIQNTPNNYSVLQLAPDFYDFGKTNPLLGQQSSQTPGTGLLRQGGEEKSQSSLFCNISAQNEYEAIPCVQEGDRKMVTNYASDLVSATKVIYGSVFCIGLTPSFYSKKTLLPWLATTVS